MAFSDFVGLSVNDIALEIKVSNVTLRALIQNKLYHDGVGITEVFATGADPNGAVLRVPKITNSTGEFRTLGATTNGGYFNSNDAVISTLTEETIFCKHNYDTMEDVPQAAHLLSLAGASAVGVRAERIGVNIAKQINAGTMAYQLAAVVNAVITATAETDRIFTYNPATDGDALETFIEACASLDDGDGGTYHDYFPVEGRLLLARPTLIKDFKKKGSVIIGGSNYAQEMLAVGALDRDLTVLPELARGYQGLVNGVPVFLASKALWTAAEEWLAVPSGYLNNIVGILCSYVATGRGYAFPEQTKIIDSPDGQGLRIQPLANFGATVFFEKGIKLLADAAFTEGSVALSVDAPGSETPVATTAVVITGLETVAVGATITMTATVAPKLDGSRYAVKWTSADTTEFTVSPTYTFTTVSTCVVTGVGVDAGTVLTAEIMKISYDADGVKTYTALATPQTDTVSIETT